MHSGIFLIIKKGKNMKMIETSILSKITQT